MTRPGGHDEGSRLSALGSRLSALGSRLSALGSRLSALGSRLSYFGVTAAYPVRGFASGRTAGNQRCTYGFFQTVRIQSRPAVSGPQATVDHANSPYNALRAQVHGPIRYPFCIAASTAASHRPRLPNPVSPMTPAHFAPLPVQELDRLLQAQRVLRHVLRQRGIAPPVGDEGAVMSGLEPPPAPRPPGAARGCAAPASAPGRGSPGPAFPCIRSTARLRPIASTSSSAGIAA